MAFLLLGQALAELLQQSVEAAERGEPGFLLFAQQTLETLAQPIRRNLRQLRRVDRSNAGKIRDERALELVVMALVLDQHGAREMEERGRIGEREVGVERGHEVQPLAQRDRHARRAQGFVETDEHRLRSATRGLRADA
jgi:hypothetical protein